MTSKPALVVQWLMIGLLSLMAMRPSRAQAIDSASGDGWQNVLALAVGAELEIQLRSGRTTRGRFASARPAEMTITAGGRSQTLGNDEIARVVSLGTHKGRHFAGRGFVIGAIAGGVWGSVATRSHRAAWSVMLAGGWGTIGAIIGAVDGAARRERTVVWQANGY